MILSYNSSRVKTVKHVNCPHMMKHISKTIVGFRNFFEYQICIINEIIYQLSTKYGLSIVDTLYWTVELVIFLTFHCKNLVYICSSLFFYFVCLPK